MVTCVLVLTLVDELRPRHNLHRYENTSRDYLRVLGASWPLLDRRTLSAGVPRLGYAVHTIDNG